MPTEKSNNGMPAKAQPCETDQHKKTVSKIDSQKMCDIVE